MKQQVITFGTALMFLTRIPVGRFCSGDAPVLSASTRYFPVVGALVGCLLALTLWGLVQIFSASVAVFLMLALGVRVTGAFHEDGLADVADSAGAFDIDKKLEIMRDSRVGTYGSLALILLILGKFVVLTELLRFDFTLCVVALIGAHVLSRWSSVLLMATQTYSRPEAANKVVAEGVTLQRLTEATLLSLLIMVPLWWFSSIGVYALLLLAWFTSYICARRFKKAFGGITGDCLGAANQIVEVVVMLAVLAYVS